MKQNTGVGIKDSGIKGIKPRIMSHILLVTLLLTGYCLPSFAFAEDNPLNKIRDETLSYFKPLTGKVVTVEGKRITVDIGAKGSIRKGMRFQILREEAPFRHPVTKEPLGKLESLVGRLEIKEVGADTSTGEIIEGGAKEGDKIRISEIKVNVLFCQSKDVSWSLSEAYHRMLKENGRFNLIDTSVDTDIPSVAVEGAKKLGAEVALLLVAKKTDTSTVLTQKLFWASDGIQFSEANVDINAAFSKEFAAADAFFTPVREEAWLEFEFPFDARRIALCDVDGDGKKEILLATGKDIGVYTLGADIQPALGGLKIANSSVETPVWLDCVDMNGDGKDEIIVTTMASSRAAGDPEQAATIKGDNSIISYIYELKGSEFALLYRDRVFMRRIGNGLIAQEYSRSDGFVGDVFNIVVSNGYKRGDALPIPKGVNIYDFVYFEDPRLGKLSLAYDEAGFLNVYDSKGMRIWRSKADAGGFLNTFTKKAPSALIDKGEWSVKDRLLPRNNKILSVKRFPLIEMIKGLGFKKAQIKALWWNGLSMNEDVLIDNIGGTLYDYAVDGDKIIVLASPLFGVKAGNILKGENPLTSELLIYKMKGM